MTPIQSEWDVAPAEHQIYSNDEIKVTYRKNCKDIIDRTANKSLLKKPFFTISTNVLCADVDTKYERHPPEDRDIYLPLEISITKWSLMDAKVSSRLRKMTNKTWMINPGQATRGCISRAKEHGQKTHKIEFDPDDQENVYVEHDWSKVVKEINSFLATDRVVYSLQLKNVRQDLGCIKWLNREVNYKMKPIKFLSLVDLYVILIRHFSPEMGFFIGEGIAKYRMGYCCDPYGKMCIYHESRSKEDVENGQTAYCAQALSHGWTNKLLDDLKSSGNLFKEPQN